MSKFSLLLKNGYVVDPVNSKEGYFDIGISEGKIQTVEEELPYHSAYEVVDLKKNVCMPGLIDTHVHLTGPWCQYGHRMLARAGVTTALDCQGPIKQIIKDLPEYGAGLNVAVIDEVSGDTMSSESPSKSEIENFIENSLKEGAIGVKNLGGHFPLSPDASAEILRQANIKTAYAAWHAGTSNKGSDIEGMKEALEIAKGYRMQLVHVNSYCRGLTLGDPIDESREAIRMLKAVKGKGIVSESHLGPFNGTSGQCLNGKPLSYVTRANLTMGGYPPTEEGLKHAIKDGYALVNMLYGDEVGYASQEEGLAHWSKNVGNYVMVSFPVNKRESAFLLATAKDEKGDFVVDALSTDGGGIPRNYLISKGLLLVKFNALSLKEYVLKTSTIPAQMLGLKSKGHLTPGADADITVFDYEKEEPVLAIVSGKIIMYNKVVFGKGGNIITTERGVKTLEQHQIPHIVIDINDTLMYKQAV
ncbi:MAG: amidohydrolase family protein [Firmicutes bacterium]|jgi:hypothetical protein|nr:amidohydrolase family protein [Bacillota bacterium]